MMADLAGRKNAECGMRKGEWELGSGERRWGA